MQTEIVIVLVLLDCCTRCQTPWTSHLLAQLYLSGMLHISVSMDTYGWIYWEATGHSLVCLYKQQDRKTKLKEFCNTTHVFLCGSVVEHCVSCAKGCGFDSQGTHVQLKCITWMHCKSHWIKASAKCINVNVNVNVKRARQPGWSILDPIRTPIAASHVDVTLTLTWGEWVSICIQQPLQSNERLKHNMLSRRRLLIK